MKKKKKNKSLGRRIAAFLFLAAAVALLGVFADAAVTARLVKVERVTISAADLPAQFDGFKILYVSDIDLVGFTTASGVARFLNRLEALDPDILILGGDYANNSLWDRINGTGAEAALEKKRRALFSALKNFDAPDGKFAVAGDNEQNAVNLAAEMALGGIKLLSDSAVFLEKDGAQISLVGLSDYTGGKTDYGAIAAAFKKGGYVIVAAHNPSAVAGVLTAEAEDAGSWCDLLLTGHNHGGQAMLFGRTMFQLTAYETRYLSGWHKESGTFVLVSEGLGCEAVNLRFGTSAQVHLITLKRGGP
jgi:predicted MPP superfamily phosphohydrolase